MGQAMSEINANRLFIGRYVPGNPAYCALAPTLASSLRVFRDSPCFKPAIEKLGPHIACLFQGYSTPGNGLALREALSEYGTESVDILAVDPMPLKRLYAELDVAFPNIQFFQFDACDFESELARRCFDLIIQDFTLNCMHPDKAQSMLQSAHSLLTSNGVCLISVSTDAVNEAAPVDSLNTALSPWPGCWNASARGLHDLCLPESEHECLSRTLGGRTFRCDQTGWVMQVTQPSGQFEFFMPQMDILNLINQCGFKTVIADSRRETDYSGITCTRIRIIATLA